MKCEKAGASVSHRCHAGLVDTVVPIKYDGSILGFILFGQIRDDKFSIKSIDEVKQMCKGLYTNEKEFEKAYANLKIT
jgi:ligand-binding sensor protein